MGKLIQNMSYKKLKNNGISGKENKEQPREPGSRLGKKRKNRERTILKRGKRRGHKLKRRKSMEITMRILQTQIAAVEN